jgi:hypothetical protein
MVKIKTNLVGANLSLPDNDYHFMIESIDFNAPKDDNGHPFITVWSKVVKNSNSNLNGKLVLRNYSLAPAAKGFLRDFLEAIGYTKEQLDNPEFSFDTDELLSKEFIAHYEKPEDSKYSVLSNFKRVKSSKQKEVQA